MFTKNANKRCNKIYSVYYDFVSTKSKPAPPPPPKNPLFPLTEIQLFHPKRMAVSAEWKIIQLDRQTPLAFAASGAPVQWSL